MGVAERNVTRDGDSSPPAKRRLPWFIRHHRWRLYGALSEVLLAIFTPAGYHAGHGQHLRMPYMQFDSWHTPSRRIQKGDALGNSRAANSLPFCSGRQFVAVADVRTQSATLR